MKPAALAFGCALIFASASAQVADPAPGDFERVPGPDELDILSEGDETDFPDIETVEARKPLSVTLRALNKVTAKYSDIVIDMNGAAKFGTLEITARYCDKRPPEEFPETSAFIEVADKSRKNEENKKPGQTTPEPAPVIAAIADHAAPITKLPPGTIFSGWMFASSPALNALEHPVYDVWVIDCRTVAVES